MAQRRRPPAAAAVRLVALAGRGGIVGAVTAKPKVRARSLRF